MAGAWWWAAALLGTLAAAAAALLHLGQRRLPADEQQLVSEVDALLPQTQCAQCGYPGCRPYAEAVVAGAPLNLCPPGGPDTQRRLEALLDRPASAPLAQLTPLLAVIDESRCIGCGLCVPPCPVDAILGAPRHMHTVLAQHCTGCELCVAPCPVDCIALVAPVVNHA